MKRWGKNSLVWQYLLSYIVILLIVMVGFFSFAYSNFRKLHTQIVLDNYLNSIHLVRENNERTLSNLTACIPQLLNLSDVSPFTFNEEPVKALKLKKQLAVLKATNTNIAAIFLRFDQDEFIYSSQSSYRFEDFVKYACQFDQISEERFIELFEHTDRIQFVPAQTVTGYVFYTYGESKEILPVLIPAIYENGSRCGMMLFLLDGVAYHNMINSIVGDHAGVYIVENGTVLLNQTLNEVPYEVCYEQVQEKQPGEWHSFQYEKKWYHIVRLQGNTFSCEYILMIPDSEMQLAVNRTRNMLILISTFIASIALILARFFVQSRIRPIKLLYQMVAETEADGNELLELQQGIQKLIDENAHMALEMKEIDTLKKSDFVRRFLSEGFEDEQQYHMFLQEYGISPERKQYAIAILAKPAADDYELSPAKMNHLFDHEVQGACRALDLHNKLIMVVFAKEENQILNFLETQLSYIRVISHGVTIAMSEVHTKQSESQIAYLEAENAFEMRFIKGNASVLQIERKEMISEDSQEKYQIMTEQLRRALLSSDEASVQAALNAVSQMMRSHQGSLFRFRCLYNNILNVITEEVREGEHIDTELDHLMRLSQCLSLEELDAMLRSVCVRVISQKETEKQSKVSLIAQKSRDLIAKHYTDAELSISMIAKEVGVSDSKLSIEFKKAYQMTPNECMTGYRMQLAVRLLSTSDMPVKDVAVQCGYYDTTGFIRRFKIYTGKTPQQYRLSNSEIKKE